MTHTEDLLAKARWRRAFNERGYEGRSPVASGHLAEALRAELRAILDNDGRPFDLLVARHVYDFAIAAKDLLTVSAKNVEDAMQVIADNGGAMESLTGPGDPQPPEQVSETFGARMLRELLATLPAMLRKNNEDLHALVGAIADARDRGMPDLAARLEQRLLGTPLEPPRITHAEVVHDSFEHGFIDGSMRDSFDRGTINGHVSRDPGSWSPAYREGYAAGQARRRGKEASVDEQVPPRWAQPGLSPSEVRDAIIAEVGMMADARTPEMQAAYDAALAREGKVDSPAGPTTPLEISAANGVES